ncbi:MAG: ABC transporter ATP-binding protein [Planctomycetia bacterium]|nr:ABC transporter ATP-binding protein [Planctomycetia bacterium]
MNDPRVLREARSRSLVPTRRPHYVGATVPAAALEPDDAAAAEVPRLQTVGLRKSYRKGQVTIPVLNGVNVEVREGEFLAVIGASGSGKSTLLHLLGTLDSPDAGEIRFDGCRVDNLPARRRDILRNRAFGMIFQFYHLLPEFTTLENVLAPLMIADGVVGYLRRRRRYADAAKELLATMGLSHRLKHRPRELSGGEMQRAAIARALVMGPQVLLADEPTGNLDRAAGRDILRILRTLNHQQKLTIVMVTHDLGNAEEADRIVRICEGRIEKV